MMIGNKDIAVSGRIWRMARLRHEWCDFLDDAPGFIGELQRRTIGVDVFTFIYDICDQRPDHSYYSEAEAESVLRVTTHEKWWNDLDFKVRNKIRKAFKSGVELRAVTLDDDFARGVEGIYNESPLRQGR